MHQLFAPFLALALTPLSIVLFVLVGLLFSLIGGALSGIKIAGADLGNEMAGLMGALYGAIHALPALIIGLIILSIF